MTAPRCLLLIAAVLLATGYVAGAPMKAPVPHAPAPGHHKCPHNYTVKAGDTYCKVSTMTGISITMIKAANPKVNATKLTAGEKIKIPCKPEIHCCPEYIVAAGNETGLGAILKKRPDLSLNKLLAANYDTPGVTASSVPCGTELLVPCKSGEKLCKAHSKKHHGPASGPKKGPYHHGPAPGPKRGASPPHGKPPGAPPKSANPPTTHKPAGKLL